MTTGSRAIGLLVVMLALTGSSSVSAQTADAEALFREGKRLLKAGEIERACEKFEASERLEAENGTELNLADCWERIGRTASAWAMFVKAAASAKREDRAAEARRRAAILERKLVRLTIEVPADADVEDLAITRNDQAVDRALWNQAVPVDPDEYEITARAPKREKWSTTIKVKTKDKVVVVPVLELRKRTRSKKPDRPDRPDRPDPPNENRSLAIGLAIGGGGAFAIATGLAFHSKSLQDRSDVICPTTACSDAGAVDLNRRARREALFANIGWSVGIAAGAAAIVAWMLGDTGSADRSGSGSGPVTVSPAISDEHAGLVLGGRF